MHRAIIISIIVLLSASCTKRLEKKLISPKVKIEFRMASDKPVDGFEEKELNGKKIFLNPKVEITEKDIACVYQVNDQNYLPTISLEMNKIGTQKFAELTANNISKMLAIIVNGKIVMAPVIQSKILGGKVQITTGPVKPEIDSLFKSMTDY